jgi:hypothetical protein
MYSGKIAVPPGGGGIVVKEKATIVLTVFFIYEKEKYWCGHYGAPVAWH